MEEGGGGQPYLHFFPGHWSVHRDRNRDLFSLPCLTMLFAWALTINLLENEALCYVQSNLSKTDTEGTERSVRIREVSV